MLAKQKLAQAQEKGEPFDLETGDAAVQYYFNAEMSKLTDSEGEYWPAETSQRRERRAHSKRKQGGQRALPRQALTWIV